MQKFGIMAISHGSRSAAWVERVDEAVRNAASAEESDATGLRAYYVEAGQRTGMKSRAAGVPAVSVFLELVEGRLIQDGIDRLEAEGVTDIVAVPLFVSSGSTHVDEIRYALGDVPEPTVETELSPFRRKARIRVTPPIDDDPDIADIVYDRAAAMSVNPGREAVLLVGHGSVEWQFAKRWTVGLERLASRVRERGGFAAADTATLLPDRLGERVAWWNVHRPELDVLVVPLFLSEGFFTGEAIPRRLAACRCRYDGRALLPHPLLTRWIRRQAAAAMRPSGER